MNTCKYLASLAAALMTATAFAIPTMIGYQGILRTPAGAPVPDGPNDMTFSLYTTDTGGTPVWTESYSGSGGVQTINGIFNVLLGSNTPIPQSVMANDTLYLSTTVGGEGGEELLPRVRLVAVAYAYKAARVESVDGATGGTVSGDVSVNGALSANSATVTGNVNAAGGTYTGSLLAQSVEVYDTATANFVNVNNKTTTKDLEVTGTLTAPGGTIQGTMTVDRLEADILHAQHATVVNDLNAGSLSADRAAIADSLTADSAVINNGLNANWAVVNGKFTAGSASITGVLTTDSATVKHALGAESAAITNTVTANEVTATSRVTAPHIQANSTLTAGTANVTGSLTASSANINGPLTANSAIITGGLTGSTADFSGLVGAQRLNVSTTLDTVNANVTGTLASKQLSCLKWNSSNGYFNFADLMWHDLISVTVLPPATGYLLITAQASAFMDSSSNWASFGLYEGATQLLSRSVKHYGDSLTAPCLIWAVPTTSVSRTFTFKYKREGGSSTIEISKPFIQVLFVPNTM